MDSADADLWTQAFCSDSFTATMSADSTGAIDNKSMFGGSYQRSASEFGDRLDKAASADAAPSQSGRLQQQQQQQSRLASSPYDDEDHCIRTSSEDFDVDLSPADVDDGDFMQVYVIPVVCFFLF